MNWIKFIIFLAFTNFLIINSFSSYLTSDYCDRSLEVGTIIMGKTVDIDSERVVKVFCNGQLLNNGDEVQDRDELKIELEPKSFQMVIEVHGNQSFVDGRCINKNRTNKNGAAIIIKSTDQNEFIGIVIGWAKSFSSGVKVTPEFNLKVLKSIIVEEL
eukprot:gene4150-5910_t